MNRTARIVRMSGYRFKSGRLSLRAGQFKVPFNGIELESAKRLLAIERGARVRGTSGTSTSTSGMLAATAMDARNRGIMALVRWADGRARVQAGGWVGAGERGENNDGKQLAARLEIEPWAGNEDQAPLVLALAVVTNGYFGSPRDTLIVAQGDTTVTEDASHATAFEAWVEFGRYAAPGLHVAGNGLLGTTRSAPRIENSDVEFAGSRHAGWGSTVRKERLTGIDRGRVDRFDPMMRTKRICLDPALNHWQSVQAAGELDVPRPRGESEQERRRVQAQPFSKDRTAARG
jgi:hypothetical protein